MKISEAKVLVVDDEPGLREIFEQWLADAGCNNVVTAADGEDALTALTETTFDLLITDVRMPKVDGITLVRRLAGLQGTIPSIVFVSGFGRVDEREMYAMGVEAFLSKPLRREDLLAVVEKALTDRSNLWATPMEVAPKQSIVIQAEDIRETGRENSIRLGRGGVSAHYSGPASLGKVAFECYLSSKRLEITGQGYVRWRSRAENSIGIEFSFLDEDCRSWVLAEIAAISPRGFIPSI